MTTGAPRAPGTPPGRGAVVSSWAGTAAFALTALPAAAGLEATGYASVVVAAVLFAVSLPVSLYSLARAAVRTARGERVTVPGLFFLRGSAPPTVRRMLLGSLQPAWPSPWPPPRPSPSASSCPSTRSPSLACGAPATGGSPRSTSRLPDSVPAMADEAIEHIRVDARPERCFEVAVDYERYPVWAADVKVAEVLERDAEGRGSRVRFEVAALGRTIGYVLDYDYAGAPREFSWNLVEADILTRLDGSYRFEPDGSGTEVTYRLAVDLSIPMPGFMKRRTAGMIVQNAMKELKRYVEDGPEG